MTKQPSPNIDLNDRQRAFVSDFVPAIGRRTRLVAAPGTGKTTVAALAAKECIERGHVDSVLVLADRRILVEQWLHVLRSFGLETETSLAALVGPRSPSVATTFQAALRPESVEAPFSIDATKRLLIVIEEAHDSSPTIQGWVDRLISSSNGSRVLSLVSPRQRRPLDSDRHLYDSEYFFDAPILTHLTTNIEIVKFAPSHAILQSILSRSLTIDDLTWRQFEKLIADLLESEGYKVELMGGTKDGGVDVIALLDQGPMGVFKTLWQAKKNKSGNKVGLSVVRELADTKNEFGASKAFIVTSTYLTRDAIQRIERDRYVLGKVDRDDLDHWISAVLLRKHGPAAHSFVSPSN